MIVIDKKELQLEYCRLNGVPLYAPYSGVCWTCGNNIYEELDDETCSETLITGCPYCHTSFLE